MKYSAVFLAGALVSAALVVTACSVNSSSNSSTSDSVQSSTTPAPVSIPSPIFFDPASLQGMTIKISRDIPLVLEVDDSELEVWSGTVEDNDVAGFSAGGSRGSYSVNPSFDAKSEGTTTATLTGSGNEEIVFTLTVVSDNEDVTPQNN